MHSKCTVVVHPHSALTYYTMFIVLKGSVSKSLWNIVIATKQQTIFLLQFSGDWQLLKGEWILKLHRQTQMQLQETIMFLCIREMCKSATEHYQVIYVSMKWRSLVTAVCNLFSPTPCCLFLKKINQKIKSQYWAWCQTVSKIITKNQQNHSSLQVSNITNRRLVCKGHPLASNLMFTLLILALEMVTQKQLHYCI